MEVNAWTTGSNGPTEMCGVIPEINELGEMATEEETDNHKSEERPGLGGSAAQSEGGQKDRESINPDGTKGNRKEISTGESSGKVGGSRQGTQGTKEGRNKDRTNPGNLEGAVSKKVRVTDTRCRLAEIDKRTAEYRARLIEEMMTGNEEGSLQEEPRDERRTGRGGTGQGDKGSDRGGTPSKRRKEGENSPGMDVEKATTPPAINSRASRLPTTPAVTRGCEGLWSLRERVLGWFDPEGTTKTREGQKAGKDGPDNSETGEASSSEGVLKKIVSSLARALNKNQGYLVDAKKKLTFDGANITQFLIDYENLAALSLKGEIFGPQGERVNWNSPGGMRRAIIMLNGLEITVVEAEPVGEIIWDQRQGRGPQVNFILENDGHDRVNATTRLGTVGKRINRDAVMEEVAGSSKPQAEPEAEEPKKVYGKPREEEPADKVSAAKKKFRYQIPILSLPEIDDTISKLLGTMVSVSFQTMLQASPRLLKGLRQLLTRRRVEIGDNPELPEGEREEEVPQEVANLQRSRGDLEHLEKAFADICLSLPDREGGEVMRSPPGTKLSFHALPVGKLKIQIGSHHTDALVDGGAEITLIRRDYATITGCTVNKEVTGSIRGAGGEIPFAGYVTKCAVKAGVRESIWSFQRMTVMEEVDHDIILERPWRANVEMIGMHLHDGSYMVDIEDPVTGRGELLRLLGTGGDPPRGKLATWLKSFEDSTRKGAFARMEGMRERVEIMIEEAFNKKEWIKMGLPQKKRRQEDTVLGGMVAEKESEVELGASLPKRKEMRVDMPEIALEIPDLLQLIKALRYHKAYLFGRRFILRIDPTNVAGSLKNYRPIDPTVGRWVGFIWQFDYKIERIAGIRNKADGLSRVCITPEGMEDVEPIDAFLEYEGGTLAVDNEMMSKGCTSGELLIQTLQKGAPAVVAELREGPVTTRGRREEKDSWGAIVGPKEELIAVAVEGGQEAVMSLMESWKRKELQWVVNQMQEGKDGGKEGEDFFYVQSYEGLFREIGLLLVGNKQPTEVSIKAREEVERYVLRGGHLFRREEGAMPRRVVCGRSRQVDVIQAMHDGLAGGHRSSKGTLAKITPLYYWPGMAGMVAIYCQTCLICQERSSVRIFEPLRPTRVLGPGHLVHLDLAVMPVSTDGYRYILDARDNLSGFVEAVAPKKKTGRSVADWIEDFYLRHPFVRRFTPDDGTKFVNQEVLGMLKRLCVPITLIEPYHPEANAPVERGHRTLKNTIAKLAADHLGNWPTYLKQAVFAENMTPKRTTGCIPAKLWYGREIDFPVEALVPTWNRLDNDPQITLKS
ncbi:hypothetical protein CBR_g57827 [Chara braunii]|uniref:Integrase catalytic domain-containing protein n=1 Tax=Chara braunii TaxID=69332 RepID=A0A388K836_CHABU|nr:hypothetical protein CBR_g57827 [Chara braunii]|eukprot:GBG66224.1 hypothetical protein CBR_g57827 [Chara braunii]